MRLIVQPEYEDDVLGGAVTTVIHLNGLCKCKSCPCYFVELDGYAGQFPASELRTFAFADDNTVTEPGPEPARLPSGFHALVTETEPVQQTLEVH